MSERVIPFTGNPLDREALRRPRKTWFSVARSQAPTARMVAAAKPRP